MFVEQEFILTFNTIAAGVTASPASITKNGDAVSEINAGQAEDSVEVQGDTTDAGNVSDDVTINVRFGADTVDTPLITLGDNEILTKFTRKSDVLSFTASNNHATNNAKPQVKVKLRIPG